MGPNPLGVVVDQVLACNVTAGVNTLSIPAASLPVGVLPGGTEFVMVEVNLVPPPPGSALPPGAFMHAQQDDGQWQCVQLQ